MDLQNNLLDDQVDTGKQPQEQEQEQQTEPQEKNKHTKLFVLVLFFLLLVFGGGGIYLALTNIQTEDLSINQESEDGIVANKEIKPEEPEENGAPYSQVHEEGSEESKVIRTTEVLDESLSVCVAFSDEEYDKRVQCAEKVLDRVETVEVCVDMEHMELQRACIAGVAVRNKDVTICDRFTSVPCYQALAKELNDVTICEKISDDHYIQSCFSELAVSAQDVDICEKITKQSTKEDCYIGVAVKKKDPELCKKIQADYITEESGPSKTSCKYAVAAVTGDIELCGSPAPVDIDKAKYGNYIRQNSECFDAVASIKESEKEINNKTAEGAIVSINFPDKLELCIPYSETFQHPFGGEMRREILGEVDGKCKYEEEMPGGGKMLCAYSQEIRRVMAQYYRDVATAESAVTEMGSDLVSGETIIKYTLNGKEVENPISEAIINGTCIITGYNGV